MCISKIFFSVPQMYMILIYQFKFKIYFKFINLSILICQLKKIHEALCLLLLAHPSPGLLEPYWEMSAAVGVTLLVKLWMYT